MAWSCGRAGFSRFRLFQEILLEKFVDLGRNSEENLRILREIQGTEARKIVAM
jgi:hypothetical protein